ncbi:MAG: peptidoglycan DD-metalloendopeptidase family protein [Actinomycetota bacterium]
MTRKVSYRALAGLLITLVVLGGQSLPAVGQPQTPDDIDRRLEEIQRLQAELERREGSVRRQISVSGARRDALTKELSELQAIVDQVQARVNAAEGELNEIQRSLDRNTEALNRAKADLDARVGALRARAAHIYKHGPSSVFELVVGAAGFGDFLRRFAYTLNVTNADNERVAQIRVEKARISKERAVIEELREKAARQLAVVEKERNRAASVAGRVAANRQAAVGDLQGSFQQLGNIQQQKERYERETAELQAESAAIAAFLRGRGSGPATVSPRGMVWPTSGKVTSGFGWRTHPIFGTRRFHAGIDIGAPSGQAVVAAGSGKVVFAGPKSGYGNTVIVDHGGGIATLYGHLSSIAAGQGATVVRGGRVAAVGCTGYCTGPHLHFEVRVNGDPVNPAGWLP